ncbi:hypothetical protein KTF37_03835 [Burkholderia multivorans]|uniref:hypothetical protein n=1 Tax=Burkholderia multivorans TaxID=87883 RepID=UPI001C24ABCD|nr:hypothetical protein [Burkholderia multivorans]MBU9675971.1 hypothetical protein [Burkholderia multivorans]
MRRDAAPRSTQTPRVEPWRFFIWGGAKVDRRRAIVRLRKRGYGTGHTTLASPSANVTRALASRTRRNAAHDARAAQKKRHELTSVAFSSTAGAAIHDRGRQRLVEAK